MAKNHRHILAMGALLALYGCAYNHTPPPAPDHTAHTSFDMRPSVLQKGTIFMRPTHPATTPNARRVAMGDPTQWVDIKDVRVVLHADNSTLESLMTHLMTQTQPHVGPWQVQWRLQKSNLDILDEPFSLNTETTFGELVSYIADFMLNYRGIRLKFEMFNTERILVITDNG